MLIIFSSISWSGWLSFGVKTFERCTAKSYAFSLSLRAHLSGCPLVRIRKGDTDTIGLFVDFTGFQMEL
jgi:hypothetical protein